MKITEFDSFVYLFSELRCKLNVGNKFRVWNKRISGSSIWIERRKTNKYRALLTGEFRGILAQKITKGYGKPLLDRKYPCWILEKVDVEKIIESVAVAENLKLRNKITFTDTNKISLKDITKDEFILRANEKLKSKLKNIAKTERDALTRKRIGQDILRELIVPAYNNTCSMCVIDDVRLLRASHIMKWSEDETNKLNPKNVLCLCGLHDLAFENGIVVISNNYEVIINSKLSSTKYFLKRLLLLS